MTLLFLRMSTGNAVASPVLFYIGAILFLLLLSYIWLRIRNSNSFRDIIGFSGFEYDARQDIFFAKEDAWQREYGYCSLYDKLSPRFGIITDFEPIEFEYRDKKYLIEFWKGQYGMTAGGEIGIYTTQRGRVNIPGIFEGIFYDCASPEDYLDMAFWLEKDGKALFRQSGLHWWQTGFVLGEFSYPYELKMHISLGFHSKGMLNAFLKELRKLKYSFAVEGAYVSFVFSVPRTEPSFERNEQNERAVMERNKELCELYKNSTSGIHGTVAKIRHMEKLYPLLVNEMMLFGKAQTAIDSSIVDILGRNTGE